MRQVVVGAVQDRVEVAHHLVGVGELTVHQRVGVGRTIARVGQGGRKEQEGQDQQQAFHQNICP